MQVKTKTRVVEEHYYPISETVDCLLEAQVYRGKIRLHNVQQINMRILISARKAFVQWHLANDWWRTAPDTYQANAGEIFCMMPGQFVISLDGAFPS